MQRDTVDDYRLVLGSAEYVPVMIGGMGVGISTPDLALEACRLGGIGHISDAMSLLIADRNLNTNYTKTKAKTNAESRHQSDKSNVKFALDDLREAQMRTVADTMVRTRGDGAVFINVMEKLTMAAPLETLRVRLHAALDGGIDGITLSAGLHLHSMQLMANHPRFWDAKIGIIVSSTRALKIFLRSATRAGRLPDYVIVEGPLAGGHLGFGDDWRLHRLENIVTDVLQMLRENSLPIPVIPAGGIFTGTDAVNYLRGGASAVQVATRFSVSQESGMSHSVKQRYFAATADDVVVSSVSPAGYPLRMLTSSPCLGSNVRPQCEPFGYALSSEGNCAYLDAYREAPLDTMGNKSPVHDKMCLCYHFSKGKCYTCGHYVYRLKDTTNRLPDGSYQLPSAEHIFKDYQFSRDHQIALPPLH